LTGLHVPRAGPSNLARARLSSSAPIHDSKPLPVTDWSRPSGSSSGGNGQPRNNRGPRPTGEFQIRERNPPRDGDAPRYRQPVRPPIRPRATAFGINPQANQNRNGPRTPAGRKPTEDPAPRDDLFTSLKKWNVSAAPERRDSEEVKREERPRLSPAERFNNDEEPDLDTRHGRRLKPGEKGRESRSFEAVKRAGGADFSLDRGHRQGSKKGKEREYDGRNTPRDAIKKADKPRRTVQKAKETEKEVYVPSTVTVSRLADIFGVKICESSGSESGSSSCLSQSTNENDAFGYGGGSAETGLL
jgi:hypothetical protein